MKNERQGRNKFAVIENNILLIIYFILFQIHMRVNIKELKKISTFCEVTEIFFSRWLWLSKWYQALLCFHFALWQAKLAAFADFKFSMVISPHMLLEAFNNTLSLDFCIGYGITSTSAVLVETGRRLTFSWFWLVAFTPLFL